MARQRERPDRIASTIFIILAGVCAVTGLIITASVDSQRGLVATTTIFQTLLFSALALVAHDVEDIKALIRSMPAVGDANDGDASTDPGWNETWRLHDRSQDRD